MAAAILQLKDFPNLCTPSGDLKYEIERLLTFHEVTHPKLTSVQLSGNGFYYDMVLKKILCYFCKTVLKTSESILKHKPSCRYKNNSITVHEYDDVKGIANQASNQNIDLEPDDLASSNSEENKADMLDYQKRFDTYKTWKENIPVKPEDLAQSGFYFLGYSDVVKCAFCSVEIRNWIEGDIVHEEHTRRSPTCSNVQDTVLSKMDFKFELNRIKSFVKWSPSHPLKPNDLAKNGFYHKGPGDNVSCVFCKCELRNWKANDNIEEKHRTSSPNCPFLCDKNIGNEPKAASSKILLNRPKHPKFALLSDRLKTFANWPKDKKQRPEDLAEAGFFYNGKSDTVICFSCDGGLCNWDDDDHPWQEHARWFPRCTFVQQMKVSDSIASESMKNDGSSYGQDIQDNAQKPVNITTFPNKPDFAGVGVKYTEGDIELNKMDLQSEMNRIKSFVKWSPSHPLKQIDLAKNGFYHKGPGDNVSCVFCQCELRNWKDNDNIAEKHRTISPNCPFLCDKNIGNERKTTRCEILLKHSKFTFVDQCLNYPKYENQRPEDLAEAGFFYREAIHSFQDFYEDVEEVSDEEEPAQTDVIAVAESKLVTWSSFSKASPLLEAIHSFQDVDEDVEEVSDEEEPAQTNGVAVAESELVTYAALVKENIMLKESKLCKICLYKELEVVLLPCGHLVTCAVCAQALSNCPVCREKIHGMVKVYF